MTRERSLVFVLMIFVSFCAVAVTYAQSVTLLQRLQGSGNTYFGNTVDMDGNFAVVGAEGRLLRFDSDPGYANVYRRSGSTWTLQQRLVPSDSRRSDDFGADVSISGNTIVVGSPSAGDPSNNPSGAIYIFGFNGTTWVQQPRLHPGPPRGSPPRSLGIPRLFPGPRRPAVVPRPPIYWLPG